MNNELLDMLQSYEQYSELYAKQIYSRETWGEQTGCEVDEYFEYVACCESRLYTFDTWYEHTQSKEFPTDAEWGDYKGFRYALLSFHP